MWIDWVTDSAEEELINPRCIFTHRSIAGSSDSLLCPYKCPKSWFKQESLTTIIIPLSFHGSGIPQGSAGLFWSRSSPWGKTFWAVNLLKEVRRDLEGEGEGKQDRKRGEPRQGVMAAVLQKAGSTWSTGHLWSVVLPWCKEPEHSHPTPSSLVISHPGQQGVNPEACLPLQIQIQCPLQIALNLCFLISIKGNNIHICLIF